MATDTTTRETPTQRANRVATKGTARHLVYRLLAQYGPQTDEQLVARAQKLNAPFSPSSMRTRRRELTDQGLVDGVGVRYSKITKRESSVWSVV